MRAGALIVTILRLPRCCMGARPIGEGNRARGMVESGSIDLSGLMFRSLALLRFGTFFQLVGEEVFTNLPFLALLYFLFAKGKLSRKTAVILAWLLTAIWFGAAHLPTYGWNFAQAFIVIGGARLVLSLAFIRTKNLWVSSGAHILNDWTLFTFALLGNLLRG
jgi:membrane protease YdiL (CAAX protease family)